MTLVVRSEPFEPNRVLSLEELATSSCNSYFELYPGTTVTPSPYVWEGNGDIERYREYTQQLAPLRILALPQVRLFALGQLADSEGQIFDRSTYFADEVFEVDHRANLRTQAYTYDPESQRVTLEESLLERRISEPCLVLSQCGYRVYGHWLLDILPKLPIRWMFPESMKVLLPAGLRDWQKAYLRMLGVNDNDVITYDPARELLHLDRAICITHPRQYYAMNPIANIAFETVRAAIGVEPEPNKSKNKLYVSRGSWGRNQNLLNSEEVEALFSDRGYDVVAPETMTPEEQVKCFSGAIVVVGEQGSGLHNTAFAPRGTKVVCLHSERAQFFAQAGLGHIRAQPTGYIFGRYNKDEDPRGNNRVFEIDINTLSDVLDRIENDEGKHISEQ